MTMIAICSCHLKRCEQVLLKMRYLALALLELRRTALGVRYKQSAFRFGKCPTYTSWPYSSKIPLTLKEELRQGAPNPGNAGAFSGNIRIGDPESTMFTTFRSDANSRLQVDSQQPAHHLSKTPACESCHSKKVCWSDSERQPELTIMIAEMHTWKKRMPSMCIIESQLQIWIIAAERRTSENSAKCGHNSQSLLWSRAQSMERPTSRSSTTCIPVLGHPKSNPRWFDRRCCNVQSEIQHRQQFPRLSLSGSKFSGATLQGGEHRELSIRNRVGGCFSNSPI